MLERKRCPKCSEPRRWFSSHLCRPKILTGVRPDGVLSFRPSYVQPSATRALNPRSVTFGGVTKRSRRDEDDDALLASVATAVAFSCMDSSMSSSDDSGPSSSSDTRSGGGGSFSGGGASGEW